MNEIKELKEKVKAIYDEICEIEKREERSGKENKPEIEEVLKSESAENYIIGNSYMDNDYDKGLYLKMLGAMLHSGESNKEEEILFARIVRGISTDENVSYYHKQAMQISRDDFEDFRNEFQNNKLKYRFILDALVLTAVGGYREESVKFVAGFMNMLGINEKEARYLSDLTKSIICQNSNMYAKAEKIRPQKIDCMLFAEYTGAYRTVLCNNKNEFKAGAGYKKKVKISELAKQSKSGSVAYILKGRNICLKNLVINVGDRFIDFTDSDYVEITGCEFLNGKWRLHFENCKKVVFKKCCFNNFTGRTIWFESVHEAVIEDCMFENCEYNYELSVSDHNLGRDKWRGGGGYGGVISGAMIGDILIKNSKFMKCGIRNKGNYTYNFAISDLDNIIAESCYFEKCMYYYNSISYTDYNSKKNKIKKYTSAKLFKKDCKNINNKIVGSLDFN